MMRSIVGGAGCLSLIAGFAIGSTASVPVRVLPANAEAIIAQTGMVPVQSQTNQLGMVVGGLFAVGGLAGVGYALLSGQSDEVSATVPITPAAAPPQRKDPFAAFNQPVAVPLTPTPSTESIVQPPPVVAAPVDGAIELDLVAEILKLSQFCHTLIAGETGTGKTTLVMQLLQQVLVQFAKSPEFDLLLIDPKLSKWGGLYQSKSVYQPAFSKSHHDLIQSVDRLERMYARLYQRATKRQSSGTRSTVPLLVVIDEVNTWLDALSQFDQLVQNGNRNCKPADRVEFLNLHNRAISAILGIGRMGREDMVWLWLIGQNPNLSALGFDGASDRANFTVVAVGCGDNQSVLDLALSNTKMFPAGAKLRPLLEAHQGKPYQLATCSRYPKNLIVTPASYQRVMSADFPESILRRFGVDDADAWSADNVISLVR